MLYADFVISKLLFTSDEFKQNAVSIQLAKLNFLLEKQFQSDYSTVDTMADIAATKKWVNICRL
jgi:hypothetical protein